MLFIICHYYYYYYCYDFLQPIGEFEDMTGEEVHTTITQYYFLFRLFGRLGVDGGCERTSYDLIYARIIMLAIWAVEVKFDKTDDLF